MKLAVIKVGKSQYPVKEGEELLVDRLKKDNKPVKKGDKVEIEEVFLLSQEGKVKVGRPKVKGAKVSLKVIEESRGKKIRVAIYKAKSRYRKTKGFRSIHTKVKVEKIST